MNLMDDLLSQLPNGRLQEVRIGAFWTAVVVDVAGRQQCGLASTLRGITITTAVGRPCRPCRPPAAGL